MKKFKKAREAPPPKSQPPERKHFELDIGGLRRQSTIDNPPSVETFVPEKLKIFKNIKFFIEEAIIIIFSEFIYRYLINNFSLIPDIGAEYIKVIIELIVRIIYEVIKYLLRRLSKLILRRK